MCIQKCFPGMKPDIPTIRTRHVALEIARRIVEAVNLDEFYWTKKELPERVEDVTQEIMRCGKAATVFSRLHKQQPPLNDRGERGAHPYGWEGIDEHCRHIGDQIAQEELELARTFHQQTYG